MGVGTAPGARGSREHCLPGARAGTLLTSPGTRHVLWPRFSVFTCEMGAVRAPRWGDAAQGCVTECCPCPVSVATALRAQEGGDPPQPRWCCGHTASPRHISAGLRRMWAHPADTGACSVLPLGDRKDVRPADCDEHYQG